MAEYRVEEAGLNFTIDSKYYNQLDIEAFSHMMKDPSYCYKFYWLEAIVQLISEGITETKKAAIQYNKFIIEQLEKELKKIRRY